MKRIAALTALVTLVLGGVWSYRAAASREREYRRLVAQGDSALTADETFVAIESFSGAIALKRDAMVAYLKRGETYRRRGDLQAALRDFHAAARLAPSATRPLERLGDVYAALHQHDRAAEQYAAYAAVDNGSASVYYKLALAQYREGRPADAIGALRQALTINGRLAEAHYLLGLCLRDRQRAPEALAAFEQAREISSGMVLPREQLADLYASLGRGADALAELEALTALDPNNPARYVMVGLTYARSGRTDVAVMTLSRAAERFPDYPGVFVALGRVWLDAAAARGDRVALRKALEALEGAPARGAADSERLTLLGRALRLAGELDRSERILNEACTKLPVASTAFVELAATAERAGRLVVARRALIQQMALYPADDAMARSTRIADLSIQLNDAPTAAVWLGRAVDATAQPTLAQLVRLAETQWRAGFGENARATVARARVLAPRDPQVRRVERLVG